MADAEMKCPGCGLSFTGVDLMGHMKGCERSYAQWLHRSRRGERMSDAAKKEIAENVKKLKPIDGLRLARLKAEIRSRLYREEQEAELTALIDAENDDPA